MGMYTGHQLAFRLRADTPVVVLDGLRTLLAHDTRSSTWPDHPFFADGRGERFFEEQEAGFGFPSMGGGLDAEADGWVLRHVGASKTETEDLKRLADWLRPHLRLDEGEVLGLVAFEDNFREFVIDTPEPMGYGGPDTVWDNSHRALVVRQGEPVLELRQGSITLERLVDDVNSRAPKSARRGFRSR
jgi:hypothetical protein